MTIVNLPKPSPSEHAFAQYVRILGKGKSGTRSLTFEEARDAFTMILDGRAEKVQIGAFLMLLRVKEETGEELAGFVTACRKSMDVTSANPSPDLDWSSYAGKKNQHPWFILSILLLVQAGYKVLIHGAAGHTANRLYTESALLDLGLPVAHDWNKVGDQLNSTGLCYMPLRHMCPALDELVNLRSLLGLRSPVHTLARMLNPLGARASIQSVFHPAYSRLHQEADRILGQSNALVFKGEVEIKPQADTRLMFLREQGSQESLLQRCSEQRAVKVENPSVKPVRTLWRNESTDDYGKNTVLGTAAVALTLLDQSRALEHSQEMAEDLWGKRDINKLPACP